MRIAAVVVVVVSVLAAVAYVYSTTAATTASTPSTEERSSLPSGTSDGGVDARKEAGLPAAGGSVSSTGVASAASSAPSPGTQPSASVARSEPERAAIARRVTLERWFSAGKMPEAESVLSDHCQQLNIIADDAAKVLDTLSEEEAVSARRLVKERREETYRQLVKIRPSMSVAEAQQATEEYERDCLE